MNISNLFNEMSTSDVIQIIGIIASLLTSVIAIIISLGTVRQNSKMIAASARPYLSIYAASTQLSTPITYLVIKNFGNSATKIIDFTSSVDFSELAYSRDAIPFSNIVETTICPGQKIMYPIKIIRSDKSKPNFINIKLKYQTGRKKYKESIKININAYCDALELRAFDEQAPLKSIAFSIQDLTNKLL